jgi:hypothetical protein
MLCLWECTFEQEIHRGMRNLAALSERTWSTERHWSDTEFMHRANATLNRIARFIQTV